ncbi:peptidase inhibitor family I36 protein [Streptomyces sp. NPDC007369]|uniref:peptidase inhibitor family I36 protein n=1 Tax=Streptomyces sp. NPDC007369 TaxID=3154589 RepID=UPI0033E3BB5B
MYSRSDSAMPAKCLHREQTYEGSPEGAGTQANTLGVGFAAAVGAGMWLMPTPANAAATAWNCNTGSFCVHTGDNGTGSVCAWSGDRTGPE